jgi:hypothetical protein
MAITPLGDARAFFFFHQQLQFQGHEPREKQIADNSFWVSAAGVRCWDYWQSCFWSCETWWRPFPAPNGQVQAKLGLYDSGYSPKVWLGRSPLLVSIGQVQGFLGLWFW